ncbi:MAG: hypothetical protein GIKADHBN_00166 [Phycisphaerales bacterium]|nr:hypothetical protein [Phycisphaerales bacterium]
MLVNLYFHVLLSTAVACAKPNVELSQTSVIPYARVETLRSPIQALLHSGDARHTASPQLLAQAPAGSHVCRVEFSRWSLPGASRLEVTSLRTGESTTLSSQDLEWWSHQSPVMNGDVVLLTLLPDPTQEASWVELRAAIGMITPNTDSHSNKRGICAPDDRVRANHPAVARQWSGPDEVGRQRLCTASLIMTGRHFVTAGHCGPLRAGAFVEFDPPDSASDGTTQVAPPHKQFPVDLNEVRRDYDFTEIPCDDDPASNCISDFGEGDDGMTYAVHPNIEGRTPGHARGTYMPLLRFVGFSEAFVKWGNGATRPIASPLNLTLKHVGGFFESPVQVGTGNRMYSSYDVDQTRGDGGGPVISSLHNAAFSVVSHGTPDSCNDGRAYSFFNFALKNLVEECYGGPSRALFLDSSRPVGTDGHGTIWNPSPDFSYIQQGLEDRTIHLAPGTYRPKGGRIDVPCVIVAPFGPATLAGS